MKFDLFPFVAIAEIVNKMLAVIKSIIPIIAAVIDNSIMFMEINLVVENNSKALYAKYPDTINMPNPGNP